MELTFKRLSPSDVKVADDFKDWVISLDGGFRSMATATLYRKAVMMILSNVGGRKYLKRYQELSRDGGYFESLLEKGVQVGTIKSLLNGMISFSTYLLLNLDNYNMTKLEVDTMKTTTSRWLSAFSKLGHERWQDVRTSESLILKKIDPQIKDVLGSYSGSQVAEARSMLSELLDTFTMSEFFIARNYIILKVLDMTGHKCGVILNARLGEYQQATENADGSVIMFVKEQKTFAEYGPMPIQFDAQFRQEVNRYTIRAIYILGI